MTPRTGNHQTTPAETSDPPPDGSGGSINWKVQIATALITAITAITGSYLQFHYHEHEESSKQAPVLRGYVHSSRGDDVPIERATVIANVDGEYRRKESDSSGYYQFPGLTTGEGEISAAAEGYKSQTFIITSQAYKDLFKIALPPSDPDTSHKSTSPDLPGPDMSPPSVDPAGQRPFRARAEANVGWSYEIGEGATPNYQLAMAWYQRAIKDGDVVANWNIGRLYEYGFGVPKDTNEARQWYQKAVDLGYERARDYVDNVGHNSPIYPPR